MLKNTIFFLIAFIFVFTGLVSTHVHAEDDVEGSKDHPMISRYEGSVIKGYEHVDYDRIKFPSGVKEEDTQNGLEIDIVEGEVTKILYAAPEELSVLQVQRNYQIALEDAGFEIVYECFGGMDEIPRAIYVVEFLASEHGISKDRLKPRGLGPWAPVASNEDEDGRARNRRVELVKMLEQ